MRFWRIVAAGVLWVGAVGHVWGAEEGPWPGEVKGWVAPAAGEHPRLLFRKGDVTGLRARAATAEGKAIVARLRVLLNGTDGQSMPTVYNGSGAAYAGNKAAAEDDAGEEAGRGNSVKKQGKNAEMPVGTYTVGHAAGYGMLFQLTGEKRYADLGRACFEKAFAGVRDRDDRYSFRKPGGALRAGPSLGAYALGYDLCYDGWDPDFRRKVAEEIMAYDEGPHMSLEGMAKGKHQFPACNHWGAEIGGPALALLAIRGDEGADAKKLEEWLAANALCMARNVTEGFGDHGYFAEGDGPGTISSDTAYTTALRAWAVAGGKDFITPRPNAQWVTLKWVMMTLPGRDGGAVFPGRGVYGHNIYARVGMSGSGTFSQGFGAIADEYKPGLLWLYERTFQAADEKAAAGHDTLNPYPHRAVQTLINWPLATQADDPGKVLPHAVEDKRRAFYMFRNRWKDADDIVVTALLKGSKGNYSVPGGDIMVYGLGQKTTFPVRVTGDVKTFHATDHGGVLSTSAGSFGVDFSAASGADALLVLTGEVTGGKARNDVQTLRAAKTLFTVMTLQKGPPPTATPDGDGIRVGKQRVTLDGEKLVFAGG